MNLKNPILSAKSLTKKSTCCMILFTWNSLIPEIDLWQKKSRIVASWGGGEDWLRREPRELSGGVDNVIYVGGYLSYTSVCIYHLRFLHFICKFYFRRKL